MFDYLLGLDVEWISVAAIEITGQMLDYLVGLPCWLLLLELVGWLPVARCFTIQ